MDANITGFTVSHNPNGAPNKTFTAVSQGSNKNYTAVSKGISKKNNRFL